MSTSKLHVFSPGSPDSAGVISWLHIGDLHLTEANQQNVADLHAIVAEVNRVFSDSLAFAYLPGDVADGGRAEQYHLARAALDSLRLPWCAVPGDHDVITRSFDNFRAAMQGELPYAFTVDRVRFVALNAFDVPDPKSFTVGARQLAWACDKLQAAAREGLASVVLVHCYPSDLKEGGDELRELLHASRVRLVEMGHTHYNELANDGQVLYAATRSTGQVEEGPVGFSITSLDGSVVSWRFFTLEELPALMITSPSDERLLRDDAPALCREPLMVRAKIWADREIVAVNARFGDQAIPLERVGASRVWQGTFAETSGSPQDLQTLRVEAEDAAGAMASDAIQVRLGAKRQATSRAPRDQDNALAAWPEHGLLGTQLGPNKNGRKW